MNSSADGMLSCPHAEEFDPFRLLLVSVVGWMIINNGRSSTICARRIESSRNKSERGPCNSTTISDLGLRPRSKLLSEKYSPSSRPLGPRILRCGGIATLIAESTLAEQGEVQDCQRQQVNSRFSLCMATENGDWRIASNFRVRWRTSGILLHALRPHNPEAARIEPAPERGRKTQD